MTALQSTQAGPIAVDDAGEPAFWQPRVALALGACKIKASDAVVTGVAKQLARLAATAALAEAKHAAGTAPSASDFTQALKDCAGD